MDFEYWMFPEWTAHGRLKSLDQRLKHALRQHRIRSRSVEERVQALELQLARVTMLARAVAELGLAKGAFTVEEFERALVEADLADGEQSGGLAPDVALPGEQRTADLEPLEDDE
jgi:hypothetical protein